jgi:hypothetical protein
MCKTAAICFLSGCVDEQRTTPQAAPELPDNDAVYAEVRRQRGSLPGYVSSNAVNDVMAAVRAILAQRGAA